MLDAKDETRTTYINIFKEIKTLEDNLAEVRVKNENDTEEYEEKSKEMCQACDTLDYYIAG